MSGRAFKHLLNDGGCPSRTLSHHTRNKAEHCRKAEAKGNRDYGWHPHHLCPHQIMGLKVTRVQHQPLQWCQLGLIDLEVPGIHTMADDATESLGGPWKTTCQSLKDENTKDTVTYHSWCWGLNSVLSCWVLRLHSSVLHYPFLTRIPRGVGEKFGDRCHSRWCTHYTGWPL